MHTLLLITTTIFLFSFSSTFGMTLGDIKKNDWAKLVVHPDIVPHICKHLSQEDICDCQLVCKDWKGKKQLMPDNIEKEYDIMMKKKGKVYLLNRQFIFLNRISENDFNAIQWIVNERASSVATTLTINTNINTIFKIDMTMLAIHNKNLEIIRLLCQRHPEYKNRNWKTCYKTITAPSELQQCLYPSHDYDFSFIPYIITVPFDKSDKLKQLYTEKIPTKEGQYILIDLCSDNNAFQCLNFLLTHKEAQQIIKENKRALFNFLITALTSNHQEIIQTFIKSKLYDINEAAFENTTILDQYNLNDKRPNCENAKIILRRLGAKTTAEIEAEKPKGLSCTIQ